MGVTVGVIVCRKIRVLTMGISTVAIRGFLSNAGSIGFVGCSGIVCIAIADRAGVIVVRNALLAVKSVANAHVGCALVGIELANSVLV